MTTNKASQGHPYAENEEWRPVPGFEGFYEVSNHGQVRGVDRLVSAGRGRIRKQAGTYLSPAKQKTGHLLVNLRRDGKGKTVPVHQIVLSAFVGPKPRGMVSRHLNGDPADNHVGNLRYGTSSENNNDAVKHGTQWQAKKTHCYRGHALSGENLANWPSRKRSRNCLACHRATGYVRRNPHLREQIQEVADRYYREIMKESKCN